MHVHINVYVYTHVYLSFYLSIYTNVYLYEHAHIHTHTHTCTYTHTFKIVHTGTIYGSLGRGNHFVECRSAGFLPRHTRGHSVGRRHKFAKVLFIKALDGQYTKGWGRSIGFTVSQVIFHVRANLGGFLIRKMTCEIVNSMLLPHPIGH